MERIVSIRSLALAVTILLVGCQPMESPLEGEPIAKVNGNVITDVDFRREAVSYVHYNDVVGMTEAQKSELLQTLIRKELLIKMAMKRELHKEEEFRKTMQDFWEQTLITNLLKRASRDIEGKVLVTKKEIEAYYRESKYAEAGEPLQDVKRNIAEAVKNRKMDEALDAWVDSLMKTAEIEIYEEAFDRLK